MPHMSIEMHKTEFSKFSILRTFVVELTSENQYRINEDFIVKNPKQIHIRKSCVLTEPPL